MDSEDRQAPAGTDLSKHTPRGPAVGGAENGRPPACRPQVPTQAQGLSPGL